MTSQSEKPLDNTNWQILRELQRDGRLSYNELGRRVGLSGPGAAERVHKLEDAGVLSSYGAQIDPTKVGLPLLAFIQLRCAPGQCLFKTGSAKEFPEVLEMHKLSGSHCALLKVAVSSTQHLEAINERLGKYGNQITNIVTSSVLTHRIIDWEQPEVDLSPPLPQGWIE
ncbi:MAG TPA: Lrp/AsnC family transcriptional regulator [Ktedonosporobacter sp.]|nr:Lrp/AsnC family transcriptional regulator [Ktedonosporobacter sp.]